MYAFEYVVWCVGILHLVITHYVDAVDILLLLLCIKFIQTRNTLAGIWLIKCAASLYLCSQSNYYIDDELKTEKDWKTELKTEYTWNRDREMWRNKTMAIIYHHWINNNKNN